MRTRSGKRHVGVLLLVAWLAGGSACPSTTEVKEIVAQSNAALLEASPAFGAPGSVAGDGWKKAVQRIDQFIAAHPDQKGTVNALRVRQAMILTVYGQDNLAKEAFSLVDGKSLTTERDKALYALRDYLPWWYKRAPMVLKPLEASERMKGREAMAAMAEAADRLDPESAIRYFIEERRAEIGWRIVNDETPTEATRPTLAAELAASLERYAGVFSAADVNWIKKNQGQEQDLDLPIQRLRRRLVAEVMIRQYAKVAEDQELLPPWKPAWVAELIVRP